MGDLSHSRPKGLVGFGREILDVGRDPLRGWHRHTSHHSTSVGMPGAPASWYLAPVQSTFYMGALGTECADNCELIVSLQVCERALHLLGKTTNIYSYFSSALPRGRSYSPGSDYSLFNYHSVGQGAGTFNQFATSQRPHRSLSIS